LRLPWLKLYNRRIDWKEFNSQVTIREEYRG
jgi:hypothetical protein